MGATLKKLRLGVIGAGAWSVASHLPNLQRRAADVEFVAVNRRDPILLEKVRSRFGFSHAFTDYRQVLEQDIDICIIGSPARWHHEHAAAAIAAKAHVLVEKPFTIDPQDAWDLVDRSRRGDRHLVVSLGYHYKPMVQAAKRLMEEDGGIGTVEQLAVTMASTTREALTGTVFPFAADQTAAGDGVLNLDSTDPPSELSTRVETLVDPAISGGGYGQVQLSHALGLVLWLTGLRAEDVFAFMAPRDRSVELHDAIAIRFAGGAVGTVAGGSSHLGANKGRALLTVTMIGSRGQVHIDLERELVSRYRGPNDEIRLPLSEGDGLYDCRGPIDTLVDLALGRPVLNESPGEIAARTVEVLSAAYESSRTGRVVHVPEEPR